MAPIRFCGGFEKLGPDKKVAARFVTVDPERDTLDILKTVLETSIPATSG